MSDIEKLIGDESPLQVGQKINEIVDYKVSKTGDTMSGKLTIEHGAAGGLTLQNTNIDLSTPPSSKQYMGIHFKDANGTMVGDIGVRQDADGKCYYILGQQNSEGVYAPTPAIGDNSTKIATTAFVKNSAANLAMPSGTTRTLTLGASGQYYTAPADGYFCVMGELTATDGYVNLSCNGVRSKCNAYTKGTDCNAFVPAKKGASCLVQHLNFGIVESYQGFLFVYAEGAK